MPLHQDVEGGQGKGQPRLAVRPPPMQDLFEMTNTSQHRQHGLDQPACVPGSPMTGLEIWRVSLLGLKAVIAQDNHRPVKLLNQGMKGGIWRISPRPVPRHDQAQVGEEQAELAAHNPPMIGFPFPPDLPCPASFADGVEQFKAVAIHHPQDRGGSQKLLRPLRVGRKEAKAAGTLRYGRKQSPPVVAYPALECPGAYALAGKEDAPRYDFTRPETGLGMSGTGLHGLVYPVEQLADKVLGSHAALLGLQVCGNLQLEGTA